MNLHIKKSVYDRLPQPLKPFAKRGYFALPGNETDQQLHSEFVSRFFTSESEYNDYVDEFDRGPATRLRNQGLEEYQKLTDKSGLVSRHCLFY